MHPAAWVVAGAVLVLLGGYAGVLLHRLWRQRRLRAQQRQALDLARVRRHDELQVSIALLARAMTQGQVSRTEAAIRISTLWGGLGLPDGERAHYRPFDALAQATAHIPVLDAWRRLPRADQDRFDAERKALELAHAAALDHAARALAARLSARPPA